MGKSIPTVLFVQVVADYCRAIDRGEFGTNWYDDARLKPWSYRRCVAKASWLERCRVVEGVNSIRCLYILPTTGWVIADKERVLSELLALGYVFDPCLVKRPEDALAAKRNAEAASERADANRRGENGVLAQFVILAMDKVHADFERHILYGSSSR